MMNIPFVVAVPARDEEELLPRLLDSLQAQEVAWSSGRIIIVANNCSDRTVSVARAFSSSLPLTVIDVTFAADSAHVGTARKHALDTACRWLGGLGDEGALLTTDADAIVPPGWIATNIRALQTSDLVGGRLVGEGDGTADDPLQQAIDAYWHYVRLVDSTIDPQDHDPPPRHGDHTGASLAFHGALYRSLGGLTPVPIGEDTDFVQRALKSGARLRHAPDVSVTVSTRTAGRAQGGMAAEMLRRQSAAARSADYLLPHPRDWVDRIEARRRLRMDWHRHDDLRQTLQREGIGLKDQSAILTDCPNDIAFVERASARLPGMHWSPIAVEAAVALFAGILASARETYAVA